MLTDFWPSATPCASAASTTLVPIPQPSRIGARQLTSVPRKCRAAAGTPTAERADTECIASVDGQVVVLLKCLHSSSPHRLYVERISRQTTHDVVSHSMIFSGLHPFLCWCDLDTLRFDPHIVHQLKRAGHDLLAAGQ